ncbi:cytochrome P450 [Pholiota conissans]|uniref:Cytochrome P450 n=1 Tax=Pholiota conissans TaxID=109636 RepID=A0A9P5YZF7_9AGAR|nr:cytochrome P450 [Pholiota conissans]
MWPIVILLSLLGLTIFTWKRILRPFVFPTIWENLPGPAPSSFLSGSLGDLLSPRGWKWHQDIADIYGSVVKIKGLFGANYLYVSDPKALHHILVKDQHFYEETVAVIEGNKMLLGEGIFTSVGERHRLQRKALTPIFTIAHMRQILPIFYEVTYKLRDTFVQKVHKGERDIDILEWMTRMALELIGQSGLGYSFDDLSENASMHPYALASKKLIPLASQALVLRNIIMPIVTIGTPRFRKFIVDYLLLPFPLVKELKEIVDVLYGTSVGIYETKKKLLAEGDEAVSSQIGRGKDIISILMKANMVATDAERLSEEEIVTQTTSLTFAATDTTSSALCRTLHLLALNKDAQGKVRQELREARQQNGGDDLDYDMLVSLPYLDAICRETLRLHPPVSFMERVVQEDIILPFATPVKGVDGEDIAELPMPKGTHVFISIIGCNRNPEFWGPDVLEWKPERWLNPLPDSVVNARIPGIYSHLLTFLGGGKSCIGFKFSQLEMKIVLAILLETFEFSPTDKEIVWQMNAIASPALDWYSTHGSLPMKIKLAPCVA